MLKVYDYRRNDEPEESDPIAPATGCLVWTLILLLLYLLATVLWFAL